MQGPELPYFSCIVPPCVDWWGLRPRANIFFFYGSAVRRRVGATIFFSVNLQWVCTYSVPLYLPSLNCKHRISYEIFVCLISVAVSGTNCSYELTSMQNRAHIYVGTIEFGHRRNPIPSQRFARAGVLCDTCNFNLSFYLNATLGTLHWQKKKTWHTKTKAGLVTSFLS